MNGAFENPNNVYYMKPCKTQKKLQVGTVQVLDQADESIIMVEIRKAPTQRLKALNKHNRTHIMYPEIENVVRNLANS